MLKKYCHPASLRAAILLYTFTAFTQTEVQQLLA